jgi:hypothetical protein
MAEIYVPTKCVLVPVGDEIYQGKLQVTLDGLAPLVDVKVSRGHSDSPMRPVKRHRAPGEPYWQGGRKYHFKRLEVSDRDVFDTEDTEFHRVVGRMRGFRRRKPSDFWGLYRTVKAPKLRELAKLDSQLLYNVLKFYAVVCSIDYSNFHKRVAGSKDDVLAKGFVERPEGEIDHLLEFDTRIKLDERVANIHLEIRARIDYMNSRTGSR